MKKDGWLVVWNTQKQKHVRIMPESEIKIRMDELREIDSLSTLEERQAKLAEIQKRVKERRKVWKKDLHK